MRAIGVEHGIYCITAVPTDADAVGRLSDRILAQITGVALGARHAATSLRLCRCVAINASLKLSNRT
jgi:hypothetical protein